MDRIAARQRGVEDGAAPLVAKPVGTAGRR